ncbi:MAG: hypothetical protein MnENMB40S_22430 [Rhizobiaceae bacterium MnEN-MB40S]|nr:MAG: hypothetical protein MnENMB40S_22430 [Rhizobiaceae bacterium MnEN-MB40S]
MIVSDTEIISPPQADGHNKTHEEIQMLRSLLNATTALTIVVSQATTPATAIAVTGATIFAATHASAQTMGDAKQRLDQARRNFERARATGEGVEEAKQELDAARAAMAGAIGERRDNRREQADNRQQQRQKPQDAAENARPEPAQDAQGDKRAAENPEKRPQRAERPERPEQPVEQAAPTPEPKPVEEAAPKPEPKPVGMETAAPEPKEKPATTADQPRRNNKNEAGQRQRGDQDRRNAETNRSEPRDAVAEEPRRRPPEKRQAAPRPQPDAPKPKPIAEAPVEQQIEAAEERPVAVVPENITERQRDRLRRAEQDRREDAKRNREALIGAAAAGIAVGVLAPALGGRVVEDEGDRFVVERDGRYYVRKDESALFRHDSKDVEYERMRNGMTREIITRRNGVQIITVRDPGGYVLRRVKVFPNGEQVVMFDTRDDRQRPVNYDRQLPPLQITIPYDQYVVESGGYGRRQLADVWSAPPVAEVTHDYTLRDIRENERVRAMVRRVDLDSVNFASGSAYVGPSQVPYLADIAGGMLDVIDRDPNALFLVEGHTDAVGSDIYNLTLSDRRAETVAQILVEAYDVPPENLVIQGYGEQYLKIDTPYDEWRNRRVTIRNITPLLDRRAG